MDWSDDAIAGARAKLLAELPHWQHLASAATNGAGGFLAGAAGAVDFTVYPFLALALRTQQINCQAARTHSMLVMQTSSFWELVEPWHL